MSSKPPNVLVVDDEEAIRDMIRFALEKAGMAVQLASGAQEALERISEKRPDIILLDWMMPGMDGWEVLRRLRADDATRETKVLILTAHAQPEVAVQAQEGGADDFMTKPFRPTDLRDRVAKMIAS